MDSHRDVNDVEIFATGTWNGHKFVSEDLDSIISNSNSLIESKKEQPPLKLGHSKNQILMQSDGQPALGWVSNLRRKGDKIIADLKDVPQVVSNAIKSKLYNKVSIELAHSKHFGYYTSALSLLGADLPAVKGLDDLSKYVASDNNEGSNEVEFSPIITLSEEPMAKEVEKTEEELKPLEVKKEILEMSEKIKENSDLKARILELEKEKDSARFSELSSKVIAKLEKDVEEGFLMPAVFSEVKEMINPETILFSEDKLQFDHEFVIKLSDGYKTKLKTKEESAVEEVKDLESTVIEMSEKAIKEDGVKASEAINYVLDRNPDLKEKYINRNKGE